MPAEFEDGFFVRKPAWHGLGTVLPDYVERDMAFQLSGQDWTVEQWEVLARKDADSPRIEVPGHFVAIRSDTHAPLHVHQDSYEVLQNTEGWDLADAVVDQDRAIQYETGITLKGGRTCAVLLRDEAFTVDGDDSKTVPYTLVSWSHDGSAAMTVHATHVRVVCSNTLSLALRGGTQRFSFRHTKNVRDRIEAAKAAVSQMRTNTQLYRDLANYLAKEEVSPTQFWEWLHAVVPEPEQKGSLQGFRSAKEKARKNRSKLNRLVLTSQTVPDSLRLTGYGLLQGGVEYLDWFGRQSRSTEGLFNRTYMQADAAKQELLDKVLAVVGA